MKIDRDVSLESESYQQFSFDKVVDYCLHPLLDAAWLSRITELSWSASSQSNVFNEHKASYVKERGENKNYW